LKAAATIVRGALNALEARAGRGFTKGFYQGHERINKEMGVLFKDRGYSGGAGGGIQGVLRVRFGLRNSGGFADEGAD
jgi:hypothetical protein